MSEHARRRILDRVMACVTGLSVTGERVFESMDDVMAVGQLPALVVTPGEETVNVLGEVLDPSEPHFQQREFVVEVVTISSTLADREASALEVEQCLVAEQAIAQKHFFVGAEWAEDQNDGEVSTFYVRSRFNFEYHTMSDQPDFEIR